MEHSEGTFKGAGGMELFYQRWRPDGEPQATLIITHGLGEHSGRYANIVDSLVPKGYAIYAFDNRGHGRSPGQRGHVEAWAELRDDLRLFIESVQNEEPGSPLFLMGHSLGGLIVLEYALRHPDGSRGVIASAPGLSTDGFSPLLILISRILSWVWPTFSLPTGLDATTLSRNPEVVREYVEDPLVHGKATPRFATEANQAVHWTLDNAADLRTPLLILHSTEDRLVPVKASRIFFDKVTVADKEMHEYVGYYHECHNDVCYDEPINDLADWLERHV
jgi:alpha-beta hydrolase superfamily lysophospholipase